MLSKAPYREKPVRLEYRLTPKGLDRYPVLMALVHWGDVHKAGRKGRPLLHQHLCCGRTFDPLTVCSACRAPLDPRQVRVQRGPGAEEPHNMPAGEAAEKPTERRRGRPRASTATRRREAS